MAIRAWKRLEKHPAYQRRKTFFKRLIGRELWLRSEVDLPIACEGGWHYHGAALAVGDVVYSFGIGQDIAFELGLMNRHGVAVHGFDPTPSTGAWLGARAPLPAGFHFHPWAVAPEDGTLRFYPRLGRDGRRRPMHTLLPEAGITGSAIEVPAWTLDHIVETLGHGRIALMKMDIEGAEFGVLDRMLDSGIRPAQLLVEFHHRMPGIGKRRAAGTVARLRCAGYRILAVSETGREVSFVFRGTA